MQSGGKIFITYIKLKEVVHREELSLRLETTERYRAKWGPSDRATDE